MTQEKSTQPDAEATNRDGNQSLRASGCSVYTLAATLAAALFTSGDGKRAYRLHFILESGEVWGGWSEAAAAAQIEKLLSAPNRQVRHGLEAGAENATK